MENLGQLARNISLDGALSDVRKLIDPDRFSIMSHEIDSVLSELVRDSSFIRNIPHERAIELSRADIDSIRLSHISNLISEEYALAPDISRTLASKAVLYEQEVSKAFSSFTASNQPDFERFLNTYLSEGDGTDISDAMFMKLRSPNTIERVNTTAQNMRSRTHSQNRPKESPLVLTEEDRVSTPDSKLARMTSKLGPIGGVAAGVYFLAQGDVASAVEAAIPFGTSGVAIVEERPTEAVLAGLEETGIGLIFTEASRPVLQSFGFDVEDGLIQSALNQEMTFEEMQDQIGYDALQAAYGYNLHTIEAHEGFRNASDRLRTIDAIDDPRTRYTELDSFLTDARIEIEGQMHAFVEGHLFDFQEMGFGLNEDVSFRPDEDTISHITAALMDKSDKGGYETVNLEADGFLRENLYSQYLPLERSLIQLTQYQAYLRVEAMTRGLDQTQDTFLASNFDQARELSDQCKADNSSPALTPQLYNQTI